MTLHNLYVLIMNQLQVCRLLTGHHTAEAIGDYVGGVLRKNGALDKLWGATVDGASAVQKGMNTMADTDPWVLWCHCHVIHLVVKASIVQVPSVNTAIAKCRQLVTKMRSSTLAQEEMSRINDSKSQKRTYRLIPDVVHVIKCLFLSVCLSPIHRDDRTVFKLFDSFVCFRWNDGRPQHACFDQSCRTPTLLSKCKMMS